MIYYNSTIDHLKLKQQLAQNTTAGGNIYNININQYLSITQNLSPKYIYADVQQYLNINQQGTLSSGCVWNRITNSYLAFNHRVVPQTYYQLIFQHLSLNEFADAVKSIVNKLYFNQYLIMYVSKPINDYLQLVSTATAIVQRGSIFTQNLNLLQSVSVIKYSPTSITNVPSNNPTIPRAQNVVLSYGNYSVTLAAPSFDNSEDFAYNRVNRQSRGGDLEIYRDSMWPKNTTLKYKWNTLKQSEAEALLLFMQNTIGQLITIIDYENNTYNGIIDEPQSDIQQVGRYLWSAAINIELESVTL